MQSAKLPSALRAPGMTRLGAPAHLVLPPLPLLPQHPCPPSLLLPWADNSARLSLGQAKVENTATYMLHRCAPAPATSPCRNQPWGTLLPNAQLLPCLGHAACPVVLPALLVLMEMIVLCPAGVRRCKWNPAGVQTPGKGASAEG